MANQFVLDCSVSVAWCFEGEQSDYADDVLDSFTEASAIVPQLWLLEVGNVLVVAERKNRITESETVRFISLLESLPIEISQWLDLSETRSLISLAREHGLSVYDAHYLWLAMEEDLPLATLDENLRQAANQTGVEPLTGG